MPDGGFDPVRLAPAVERADYTVKKGESRSRSTASAAPGARPALFLVHGSSNSALSSLILRRPAASTRR